MAAVSELALRQPESNEPGDILEFLNREYRDRIFRYCLRYLRDWQDAEDTCSTALFRASTAKGGLREDGAFATWLYRIARNCCIDELRKRDKQPVELSGLVADKRHADTDIRLTVEQAVQDLPEEYRAPIILADLEEISAREGATILGITVPAFKSRLYRGRRALRDSLLSIECDNGRAGFDRVVPQHAPVTALRVVRSRTVPVQQVKPVPLQVVTFVPPVVTAPVVMKQPSKPRIVAPPEPQLVAVSQERPALMALDAKVAQLEALRTKIAQRLDHLYEMRTALGNPL